ncbi:MAG TPA: acyl-CoA thioesterase [Planctomycetaceae bacterium]|nr:acyl-CoA thioesterase [Planctomycetaceae bacterium]
MPAVFELVREIRPEDIDGLGHVNNLVYLKWMQSAAMAHSTEQGWSADRYQELKAGWVVRSHFIEYLRPAFTNHGIIVRTWVSDMKRFASMRRYQILRDSDRLVLAKAETNWAFVDYVTGKLTRVPNEVAESFEIVTE